MESDEEFVPPPSKRCGRSNSQDDDRGDPTYRGSIDAPSSPSDKRGVGKSDYFPASKLFEYQWPLGDKNAEFYMLQEQVKDFLDIRGIQRKYPYWRRRTLDIDERKYLVGRGVVTETQSNMGLVALCSEEVLEVMAEDHTQRYSEYVEVIREREFQETLRTKMMEARRMTAASALLGMQEEGVSHSDMRSQAMQMVADFNNQISKQRQQLTGSHIDNQTKLHHVPRNPQKVLPVPKKSRYPVALLPGQYSDNVPTYTSEELNQLPLNTVAGLPTFLCSKDSSLTQTGGASSLEKASTSQSSAQDSSKQATSSAPKSSGGVAEDIIKLINSSTKNLSASGNQYANGKQIALLNSLHKLLASYSTGSTATKRQSGEEGKSKDVAEPPSKMSASASARRSSLTDLLKTDTHKKTNVGQASNVVEERKDEKKIVKVVDTVVEGTSVSGVKSKDDEGVPVISVPNDKMPTKARRVNLKLALCSLCRKGRGSNTRGVAEDLIECGQCGNPVHPTCYNLPSTIHPIVKTYGWQCLDCKTCQVCKGPHDEDKMVFCDDCDRGYHTFCVGLENIPSGSWLCPVCGICGSCKKDKPGLKDGAKWKHEYLSGKFITTLCTDCSSYFRQGSYCPVCYKVYHNDETDAPMVCCDRCDRWIHTVCDDISDKDYKKLSQDKSSYICSLCRGK